MGSVGFLFAYDDLKTWIFFRDKNLFLTVAMNSSSETNTESRSRFNLSPP